MDAPEEKDPYKEMAEAHFPNCRHSYEPGRITLVGGPCCGNQVPQAFAKAWDWHVPDKKRKKIHIYERRSPTSRNFHFKESRPLYEMKI